MSLQMLSKAGDNPLCRVRGVELSLGDALDLLSKLPEDSVDLAIVDPPYGASSGKPAALPASHGLEGFGGAWTAASHTWDFLSVREQLEGTAVWMAELQRVVKPTGSMWIHSTYHNSGFVNVVCQQLGIEIINEVVWYKRNSFPNLRASRLTASHETILWAHSGKGRRNYRFNYDKVKTAEYPEDQLKSEGKQMRTVWDIPNNKKRSELEHGKHPTQKPERLVQRLIDISAPESGVLLAPFAGSGTELVVGMRNGLQGVGFELEREYFDIAASRLRAEAAALESQLFPDGIGM